MSVDETQTDRPGPQPANRIAGTIAEQLARVTGPRPPKELPPALVALVRDLARDEALKILADELPRALAYLLERRSAG